MKISLAEFGREVEIETAYLSNLEHARTPLRFRFAHKYFFKFPLNPVWLATGNGPRVSTEPIFLPHELDESFGGLFSEVFDEKLAPFVNKMGTLSFFADGSPDAKRSQNRLDVYHYLCHEVLKLVAEVPDDCLDHFFLRALSGVDSIVEKYPKQSKKLVADRLRELERSLARVEVLKALDSTREKRKKLHDHLNPPLSKPKKSA